MDYKSTIIKIKNNIATIECSGRMYECPIKYSLSHGYYVEFTHGHYKRRVTLDKENII